MAQKPPEKPKSIKAAPVKSAEAKMEAPAPETTSASTASNDTLTSLLTRLSQQFNLLALLIVALFLFQAYTFYKLKTIEGKAGTGAGPAAAAASPLSKDSIMGYAKELKLDEKKFEQCLDKGSKKAAVQADTAQAASLKVQGTPGFFINGRFLGGAFPYEVFKEIIDKELAGTATDNCTDYSTEVQQFCSDPANLAFNPVPQKVDIGNAQVRGAKNAKITLVEFSDFECPYCHRAYPTVLRIEKEYAKNLRLVYKEFPLTSIHPNAERAAEASLCAGDQGKFWDLYDKMFSVQAAQ